MAEDEFYPQVPVFDGFARLTDTALYRPLPEDWVIGLSDVVSSTAAIRAGQYKSVNVAGAALIAAVSNALAQRDFPFAFGGDGASFALPPGDAETARAALAATAAWVRDELGLTLRVGLVPVASIRTAGWDVRVARYAPSPNVTYAMFMGGGLAWAERELKAGAFAVEPAPAGTRPDLTGLSCRWQEFPARHGVVVSLIAAPAVAEGEAGFRELVGDILRMTGRESEAEHPMIDLARGLAWPPPGLDVEARASRGAGQPLLLRKLVLGLHSLAGWALFRFGIPLGGFQPRRYMREMVANADYRKYDDGLRMTLDCTPTLANRLEARLLAAEQAGIARFGLHRQDSAIVTCFTPSPLRSDHVHFVDGAAGGYAAAASRLKPS
ncbi:DUF3095 domain-containing protein [Inquilinus sp. NPDC058860]|uniref:DUF3095 domain-containing protein n=1 Tax=Inquilinus sp. NPDC058860 TaxID=3346652 RepID=UPI00369F04CE